MHQIPRPALLLGLAGVLPFLATTLGLVFASEDWLIGFLHRTRHLYALAILSFMSGCVWAFATKADDHKGYALSTLPCLFGFFILALVPFMPGFQPGTLSLMFAVGFVALLQLDSRAARLGQTPVWWMSLRVLLTGIVVVTLVVGAFL